MSHRCFIKSQPISTITTLPDLGMDKKEIAGDFKRYYGHRLGRDENCRSLHYAYEALSMVISDRLTEQAKKTYNVYKKHDCKRAIICRWNF